MGRFRRLIAMHPVLKITSLFLVLCLLLAYLSPYVHPETMPLIPFFGLGYPIIVSLFILFTIPWFFISKRWTIFMLAVLVLGGKLHFRTLSVGGGDDPGNAVTIKVMSYNVHLFDVYNSEPKKAEESRQKILKFLQKEQPDILCFQEFYQQDAPTAFVTKDTIAPLLKLPYYHERYAHRQIGRQNFGIALFSKFPIIKKGEVVLGKNPQTSNYCIYVDFVKNADTLRVYNVHLQSIRLAADDKAALYQKESQTSFLSVLRKIGRAFPVRASQAETISDHIKKSPYPVIVCGDFNDTPMSYTYNQFNRNLVDAFRNCRFGIGKTYAGSLPAGRIDYIFHSWRIGSTDFKVHPEALSDHYAISCKLFVKKK